MSFYSPPPDPGVFGGVGTGGVGGAVGLGGDVIGLGITGVRILGAHHRPKT